MRKVTVLLLVSALSASLKAAGSSSVEGVVVDAFGVPLETVAVQVLLPDGTRLAASQTDASGSYRFTEIPDGRHTLTFALRGFHPKRMEVDVQDQEVLRLRTGLVVGRLDDRRAVLSGSVFGAAGRPISGATLSLSAVFIGEPVLSTRTNRLGRYSADLPSPGLYSVTCSAPGYASTSVVFVSQSPFVRESPRTLDFTLAVLGSQEGR